MEDNLRYVFTSYPSNGLINILEEEKMSQEKIPQEYTDFFNEIDRFLINNKQEKKVSYNVLDYMTSKNLLHKLWNVNSKIRSLYSKYLEDKLIEIYDNDYIEHNFQKNIEDLNRLISTCKEIIKNFEMENFELLTNKQVSFLFLDVYDTTISFLKKWDDNLFKQIYFKLTILYKELCRRMIGIPKKKFSPSTVREQMKNLDIMCIKTMESDINKNEKCAKNFLLFLTGYIYREK